MRQPLWPLLASAACLGYFALLLTTDLRRPEPPGYSLSFDAGGMYVTDVAAGSVAARAGLRAGDRIRRIGVVQTSRRIDALAAETHLAPGQPMPFVIERDGGEMPLTLTVPRASWRYWTHREGVALLTVRGVQFVTVLLASFLLLKRPRDRPAILGAWLLASVGIFSVTLPYGFSHHLRALPSIAGAALFVPYVMSIPLAAVAFTFFATFPRPLVRGAGAWTVLWTPMIVALGWHAYYGWHLVYAPERVHTVPDWSTFVVGVSVAYGIGLVAAAVLNYQRLHDVNDRRRWKVLVAGTLVGSLSGGPVAVLYWIGPGRDNAAPLFASPLASIGVLMFLAFPLAFAHAILRHRLFDVSLIIRRGLQYALARGVLVSAVPAIAVLFVLDLLVHGDRPLVESLRARGAIYAVLGGLAIVAHARREAWLDALDRRFFRERYNAQQILRRIAEDIRTGVDLPGVGARLVAQIETALHPAFVALLARAPGEPQYACLATAPAGRDPAPIAANMRLLQLIAVLRRPADVSRTESAWIRRELPVEEDAYLTKNGIELLVPAGSHALIALGAKQSEEPYSGEDEDLLAAIGESLAVRFGGEPRTASTAVQTFEECTECGTCYDTGTVTCARDSAALRAVAMPRALANRYRLERRLGHGGMGTVYAAVDTALGRRVAAKVIRDDTLGAAGAAERFQHEARLAAALTHPNVITVYDFGVFDDRAFLVMELLDGTTLRERLRAEGPLAPARAVEILRGVCAAVEAAHQLPLIHRDLKPENIFLSKTAHGETVKVLDFGIAKMLAPSQWTASPAVHTAEGVLVGTLAYMAPEQLRGEPVSASWDLWAIAVIAHELITGRHPFGSATASSHTAGTPWAGEACAPAVRDFLCRALSPDPAERPASAAIFIAQFAQAAGL